MEITKEMQELCAIYHQRNVLAKERDSLRHKYKYLQDIKNSKQVKDSFEHSALWNAIRHRTNQLTPEMIKVERDTYLKNNPIPKKYEDIKLSDFNMLLLEAEKKVLEAKIKIMKHTKKYEKRIKELAPNSAYFSPKYVCGVVTRLNFYDTKNKTWFVISQSDIKKHHDETVANKAIDKMLRG